MFTKEQIKQIAQGLALLSKKDSNFEEAKLPFKGDETISFVQNGRNVKAPLKELVEQFLLLGVSDFLNVTTKFNEHYVTLNQAINTIPFLSRKIGQVITFLDTEGNWQIYQFKGTRKNQWNNITLWENVISTLLDSKLEADEEDITTKKRGDKYQLKFKDKEYNKEEFSGLGKVILRKNVSKVMDPTEGKPMFKNLLTQPMFKSENTIYVIRYDYSLNGDAISLPKNSTLEFDGGSIVDGKIEGRNTRIINSTSNSFINIKTTGTWNTELSEPIEGEVKTINVVRDIIANQNSITNIEKDIDNIEEDIKDIDKDLSRLHEDFNKLPKVDEEDITVGEDNFIRFKDKEYSPEEFSGLGRVYLRKNIKEGRNILNQDMINTSNTRFIIQYDYNLNGGTLTVPEGCTLDFQGGSLNNGSVIGNNTRVLQQFKGNAQLKGSFNSNEVYVTQYNILNVIGIFDCNKFILTSDITLTEGLNITTNFNIIIDGNNTTLKVPYINLISNNTKARLCITDTNISITGNTLHGSDSVGFSAVGFNQSELYNSFIEDSYNEGHNSLYLRGSNVIIDTLSVSSTSQNNKVLLYNAPDVILKNSKFNNLSRVQCIGVTQENNYCIIDNNILTNCLGGIIVNGGIKYNITISNNKLYNCGSGIAEKAALNVHGGDGTIIIDSNIVQESNGSFLDLDSSVSEAVSGNGLFYVTNNIFETDTVEDNNGVSLWYLPKCFVSGNRMKTSAVKYRNSNINFSNNIFEGYKANIYYTFTVAGEYSITYFQNIFIPQFEESVANFRLDHDLLVDNTKLNLTIFGNTIANPSIKQFTYYKRNESALRVFNVLADIGIYDKGSDISVPPSVVNSIRNYGQNGLGYYDGSKARLFNGLSLAIQRGDTASRPSLTSYDAGFQYYDSTLKKSILWNGREWTNMDGTPLK